MNLFLEIVTTNLLILYYWLEAIVLKFIPARFRKKSIKGENVLITGAGKCVKNSC